MLRFNVTVWETVQALSEFQYILCYGSTSMTVLIDFEDKDFNTSYVTVQLKSLLNASTLYIISIHPMLRFNTVRIGYVLSLRSNFNTSYVTVQRSPHLLSSPSFVDFNTSYVTVQPLVLCDLYFLSYRKTIDTTSVYKNFSNDRHFFQKRTKNRLWYMCIRASFFLSIFYHWKI